MLMAAMNSDVNNNHLVTVLYNSGSARTALQLVSNVALDATKSVIVMMAVMKRHVATIVLDMMLFLAIDHGSICPRACNGITECDDGSDEMDCPSRNNTELPG